MIAHKPGKGNEFFEDEISGNLLKYNILFLNAAKKECSSQCGRQKNMAVCQNMYKNSRDGHPNNKDENAAEAAEKEVDMEHFVEETRLEQFWRRLEEKKAGER